MSEPTQFGRIEQKLNALIASWDALEGALNQRAARRENATSTPTNVDLDSDYGNFVVKKCPPRWKGRDYTGKRLSETEADFCDAIAGLKRWAAGKDREAGKDPKFAELDAARAEGWAARLRSGWTSKPQTEADDEVPF